MKNFMLSILLLTSLNLAAQEYYWTTYNFDVKAEDEEIVAKLTNDYFSSPNSKAEGVSVFLFENHFIDNSNNSSHAIVFTGTLEAMGKQYSQGDNLSWDLYISKMNRYIESHSSSAGKSLVSIGEPGMHPVQNIYILRVDNESKFASAWETYNRKWAPNDRRLTLGKFSLGRSSSGETHYVLNGLDSFEDAFNPGKYRESNPPAEAAWRKFVEEFDENAKMVRTMTRVMLGKW